MRVLLLFVIGFVIGCAAGIWFIDGLWLLLLAGVCFALWFSLRYFKDLKKFIAALSIIFFGLAIGCCWLYFYDLCFIQPARSLDGVTRVESVEVTDYSTLNSRGTGGKGKIEINGKSYKVYFYLSETCELAPGDRLEGDFYFTFTGFGGENDPTYHQGSGIFLIINANDPVKIDKTDERAFRYFPVRLRKQILDKLDAIFPSDVSGFAKSLLLGDTRSLSTADDAALKISGIRHIVAVSGLHISILISFIYIFVRDRRYISAIICIPLILLFAALAGFTPSVVRACVMQIAIIIGKELEADYDAPTALSLAVLVLVGINPLVLTSVSFQLSVACVIGIMLFCEKIHDFLMRTRLGPAKGKSLKSKVIRTCVQSTSVTLSTLATTLPISAYYFGTVSLISILSNMLLLWLVTYCFYGIVLSCLFAFLIPTVGTILAAVVSWIIRAILYAASLLSKIPFAAVSATNLYVLAWIVFVYVLFAVFLLSKKRRTFLLCGLAALSLCVVLTFSYLETRMDDYRVTVFDVGQGQCILIQSKNSCYLVDCGGFSDYSVADLAAQTLRSYGFTKIDGLILTHFDYDHAGNAESCLCQIAAENIYIPDADADNRIRKDLESKYADDLCKVISTEELDCGIGQITIYPGESGKDGNESSLCILFQAEDCDILITGDRNTDGERYLLQQMETRDIDVLVAGHHGAKSSTSLYLLQNIKPRTVVISVGEDNSYGHPDPVIINRLKKFNCTIWRTDRDGTVVFRG